MALILVMLLLLIMLPFTVEFTMQVTFEAKTAANVADQLKIENAIDGQYEVMLAYLRYDAEENDIDTLEDRWNDEEVTARVEKEVNVALTTTVADEQGKFNLRLLAEGKPERQTLAKQRLKRILVEFRRDYEHELSDSEAESWVAAIEGWLKKGGVRANIPSPRMADDRTILLLEELVFLPELRGHRIDHLLYDQRSGERVSPGLHRYVTIYGDGKLNLNTVDPILLRAYFFQNPELGDRILERRDAPPETDDGLTSYDDEEASATNPYTDVMQITEVEGVTPPALVANGVDAALDFDVRSNFFSFRIVGETDMTRRDELFVVERVPAQSEDETIEGFRLLLRQERTDALETLEEEE